MSMLSCQSKGPYENHYYHLGDVIRGTVKDAQELLGQIGYQISREEYFSGEEQFPPGTSYPQSIGELCIEVAQDTLLEGVSLNPAPLGGKVAYVEWTQMTERFPNLEVEMSISRRDIQNLRRALYHKHTDREKERKTARCERLIELIREDLTPVTTTNVPPGSP